MEPVKVILDTDIGDDIDDALAVAFALRRPELDVKAITTVWGQTDLRTRLLAKLLAVLGRDDIPIASGHSLPLREVDEAKRKVLETRVPCQCAFVKEEEVVRGPTCESAEELIVRTVEEHASDICVATIGPMTNLGAVIRDHPDITSKIRRLSMMGGCYALNRSEYNVACDPEAAGIVLRSDGDKFLGTWEVTRRVVMREPEIERLRRAGTALSGALSELIALWMPHRGQKPGPVLYDLSALLWCYAPEYYTTVRRALDVETEGRHTRGYTVKVPGAPTTQVTTDMRADEVLALFMDTVCGG